MIRIAIVEDEKACQSQLQNYLDRYGKDAGQDFRITIFQDGIDIVENYQPCWDIIFMDIKMKHMDGMSAAARIREFDSAAVLIFITTMAQYAIKGYEVDALDFVLKPLIYPQFVTKLQKALNMLGKRKQKYLMLPAEDRKERVCVNEILFIEVKNHNLHIVTKSRTYVMRRSMQEMEKELEGCHFSRCSNSYLVNLGNVTGTRKETVLAGEYELPVSRTKKKQFLKELSDYLTVGY